MLGRIVRMQILFLSIGLLLSVPCFAQMDLSGEWGQKVHEDAPERGAGPDIGDYTGLPINDRARMQADSWDAAKWLLPEHQCEPHPADYSVRGPGSMRIWADIDPLTQQITAWHTAIMWMNPERTIYMDGRAHPAEYAPHTWGGFSTGQWVADMLKVETTHLKEGWLRRNGLPRSEKATMTEYFIRHGDYFTSYSNLSSTSVKKGNKVKKMYIKDTTLFINTNSFSLIFSA